MVSFTASPSFTAPRWQTICMAWVGLWLLALWGGPDLLSAVGLNVNSHGHSHLHAHGHPFVDARALWGVPNFMDVLSNLPLAAAGVLGLLAMRRRRMAVETRRALLVFFSGLLLTGFGSAWYHWGPDATGLVLDRMGMAVTFAGALALAVAERVAQRPSALALRLTLVMAVTSAVLPLTHGNVLPWAVVQFGGVALIVWATLQTPVTGALGIRLGVLIALYAAAKLLELGDEAVFHATGEWVSGHTLKHVTAAFAVWPLWNALRQNPRASGGATVPAAP